MSNTVTCDIKFFRVTKEFLLGRFRDVVRSIFGFEPKCPKIYALKDVSFDVFRGELVGVLGRNGAGKSTLLRVAGGISQPESGKVYVRGNPTAIFELGLFGNKHLSGNEFCDVYFNFMNIPSEERPALIDDVKNFTQLERYFEEPMHTYSSGMLARLFFGVVTAVPADIVLLDEILSIGDEYFQGKSFKRLLKMIASGKSGILVTHDWFKAVRLCSKIIILDQGKIEFQGTSQEAVREYLKPNIQTSQRVLFRHREQVLESILYYETGEPFTYSFEVESTIDEPFCVGLAFEIPRLSVVAILNNDNLIADRKGVYRIILQLPSFPISYFECYL
jgi:lipopolysaccharide transport system ATP-binding protein